MTPGAAKANNNENECGGDVTERVVAFRKPTSTLGKDDDDKETDEDDESESEMMEEEEHAKFATLEASYPTHI